ncbi:MAG: methylenetetrahydrofolate reductase [NAD(P)H] [Candidatus Gastranaerophilales bacterium]|nr:methylenetetrahydrofolate reductase [NAD(P)H] [Candidatus Gastranaerophilales bacterium]
MKLSEIYKNNKQPVISFEVFPPKGEGAEYEAKVTNLFKELEILKKFNPSLISVTYGAGGSSREKTYDLVLDIKNKLNVEPMAHFTCVNFDKSQVLEYVKKIEDSGIKNVLALRGDPPQGTENFVPPQNGFAHANELVKFIKENTDLSIAVAGYPEKHPEAVDFQTDLLNLNRKVSEGADVIFTQLFFDNNDFKDYYQKVRDLGITIPVIPGIMIIQSISQIERIINLSGSKIPESFKNKLYDYQNNPDDIKKIGIDYAIKQVEDLLDFGVKGLHFYPLNKSYAVSEVLNSINIR